MINCQLLIMSWVRKIFIRSRNDANCTEKMADGILWLPRFMWNNCLWDCYYSYNVTNDMPFFDDDIETGSESHYVHYAAAAGYIIIGIIFIALYIIAAIIAVLLIIIGGIIKQIVFYVDTDAATYNDTEEGKLVIKPLNKIILQIDARIIVANKKIDLITKEISSRETNIEILSKKQLALVKETKIDCPDVIKTEMTALLDAKTIQMDKDMSGLSTDVATLKNNSVRWKKKIIELEQTKIFVQMKRDNLKLKFINSYEPI